MPDLKIKSNVYTGKDALRKMLDGMLVASSAIRETYGPMGGNGAVEIDSYPGHMVANDAQSLVQAIFVEDPVAAMGLDFTKELCNKAELDSGDGRKTTIIMGETIMEEGYSAETDVMQLRKDLIALYPLVEKAIDDQATPITKDDLDPVAAIASESSEIGAIIGEIYSKIGKEGVIEPEYVLGQKGHRYDIVEGVRFQQTGYLSLAMAFDEEARKEGRKETRAVYENPTILVTKKKFQTMKEVGTLLTALKNEDGKQGSILKNSRDLVIFTGDMDTNVAQVLINTHKSVEAFNNILIVKAPTIFQGASFEDFSKCVGATIVEDSTGVNFTNLQLKHLGTCDKIVVTKDETLLLGTQDITDHLKSLKEAGDNDSLLRASWLSTKTALLKIGADTETALAYIRLKASDAINSSRLALIGGIVPGGGVCLYRVTESIPDTVAGTILKKALCAPFEQNLKNMGMVAAKFPDTVVDAAIVQKNAVRNAISLASTLLTTKVAIVKPPKTAEQVAHEIMSRTGQRPF